MDGTSLTCPNCQAELGRSTRFCPRCGQRVITATPDAGLSLFDPPPPTLPALPHRRSPVSSPPPVLPPREETQLPYPGALPAPTRSQEHYPPRFYEPRPTQPPPVSPPRGQPAYGAPGPAGIPPQPYPYQPPPGPPRPPGPPPRRDRRSGSSFGLLIVLLVVLVGGATAVLLLAHPFRHTLQDTAGTAPATRTAGAGPSAPGSAGPSSSSSAPASSGTTSPGPSSGPATEQAAAATQVASMLSGSAADRTAIVQAYQEVGSCGAQLAAAPKAFADAASSRRSLIASLAGLSGRAALPPALVSDLTKAWQASIAADNDYAKWADDEIAQGCVPNDASDPAYQSAAGPDAQSTKFKDAFVALWNPIAAGYGLTQYQASQL